MKKIFTGLFLTAASISFAQNNTEWYSTGNSAPAGYIGIGTNSATLPTNTPLPSFNFHVHGLADYIVDINAGGAGDGPRVRPTMVLLLESD
jgi:hypothetical protein